MAETKEYYENQIKIWEGKNKYIVRNAKAQLRKLEVVKAKPKLVKPLIKPKNKLFKKKNK